jgi:transposase
MKMKHIYVIIKLYTLLGFFVVNKNKSLHMDAMQASRYLNGFLHCMEATACNAISFQDFLQYVVKENPQKHIVMVLDNARIHHAKLLKPFLRKNSQRLTLIFLPPYSPNLNLLERIWKWLKESVISNRFHSSKEEIRASVVSFLEYIAQCPEKVLQRLGVEQLLKY